MEKQEKTYIINGQEVNAYGEEIKQKKSKKVLSILAAVCLTGLLSTGAYLVIDSIPTAIPIKEPNIVATFTKLEESAIEEKQEEYNVLLSDGTRIIATKDNILEVISNQDVIRVNGIYYSTTESSIMHIETSYNNKDIKEPTKVTTYVAPSGYVLIGKKCYKAETVIDATSKEENGQIIYTVPAGYKLVGNKGVKITSSEDELDAEEKVMYHVPPGYTLENGKAVRNTIKTVDYLLTQEEYINDLDEILSSNGSVKSYRGNLVKTLPMSELYDLLGVEQPKINKLTK